MLKLKWGGSQMLLGIRRWWWWWGWGYGTSTASMMDVGRSEMLRMGVDERSGAWVRPQVAGVHMRD